jgi:hypothetical protein
MATSNQQTVSYPLDTNSVTGCAAALLGLASSFDGVCGFGLKLKVRQRSAAVYA